MKNLCSPYFLLLHRSPLCNCRWRCILISHSGSLRGISDNSAAKNCFLIPFFCIDSDHSNGWVSLFSHRMLAQKNLHMAQEACLGFRGTLNVRVLWSSRCSVFLSCLPGDLLQAQNSKFVDFFLFSS